MKLSRRLSAGRELALTCDLRSWGRPIDVAERRCRRGAPEIGWRSMLYAGGE